MMCKPFLNSNKFLFEACTGTKAIFQPAQSTLLFMHTSHRQHVCTHEVVFQVKAIQVRYRIARSTSLSPFLPFVYRDDFDMLFQIQLAVTSFTPSVGRLSFRPGYCFPN